MASQHITVSVKLAWWAKPYLHTLALLCRLTGLEPNTDRVWRVLSRAISVRTT